MNNNMEHEYVCSHCVNFSRCYQAEADIGFCDSFELNKAKMKALLQSDKDYTVEYAKKTLDLLGMDVEDVL